MAKIDLLCHSSIKISGNKIIYIDPYNIKEKTNDADYIFCTHSHYDHFSTEDIKKVKKEGTKILIVKDAKEEVLKLVSEDNLLVVEPDNNYKIDEINFKTTYAYNINKNFHPKENKWVGYLIEIDGSSYYIAGDTDITEENQKIKCDVAFVPVGGTYTMNYKEAAELINIIQPKVAVPIHYGSIVGTEQDAANFSKLVSPEIKVEILMK